MYRFSSLYTASRRTYSIFIFPFLIRLAIYLFIFQRSQKITKKYFIYGCAHSNNTKWKEPLKNIFIINKVSANTPTNPTLGRQGTAQLVQPGQRKDSWKTFYLRRSPRYHPYLKLRSPRIQRHSWRTDTAGDVGTAASFKTKPNFSIA